MKIGLALIFLISIVLVACPVTAKTFYLSDGAAVEYKKVWKQGDIVFLLVNRDTLVEFSLAEIDQRKSLRAAGLKRFPSPNVRKGKTSRDIKSRSAARVLRQAGSDAAVSEGKTVVFNDYQPAQPDDAQPRSGAGGDLSQELLAVYESLHNAMKSRKVAEVRQHLSSRNVSSMGERELAMIESGVSLMPPNRMVTGSSSSADGSTATLEMSSGSGKPDAKPAAIGTISFVWEDGAWKLDRENWQMNSD